MTVDMSDAGFMDPEMIQLDRRESDASPRGFKETLVEIPLSPLFMTYPVFDERSETLPSCAAQKEKSIADGDHVARLPRSRQLA